MSGLSRVLLGVFILGLGLSITVSQTALALLTLSRLWALHVPDVRARALWPLWKPVLAFSIVSALSALASGHPLESLVASKGLLLVAALYVTAHTLRGPADTLRFLSALLVVASVASLVGMLQAVVCPGPAADYGAPAWLYHRCYRARGFFSIYMTLAGVLTIVLLATLPQFLSGGAGNRWLGIPWFVGLGGLVATYTRGAWLGFAAGALVLLPRNRKGRWLLLGAVLLVGLVAWAGPQHLRQRLLTMGDPDDLTVKERIYMWRSGIAMWRGHPLWGVGPGGVKREYRHYVLPEAIKKGTSHLHNTPLQILVERGVVGLVAWVWIWVAFYSQAIRLWLRLPETAGARRAIVAGSLAAITGFLVAGLTEYNFGDSEVVMVAWAMMALPFAVAPEGSVPNGREA